MQIYNRKYSFNDSVAAYYYQANSIITASGIQPGKASFYLINKNKFNLTSKYKQIQFNLEKIHSLW